MFRTLGIRLIIILQFMAFFIFSPYMMLYGSFRYAYVTVGSIGICLLLFHHPRLWKSEVVFMLYLIGYFLIQVGVLRHGSMDKVTFIMILFVTYLFNRLCIEQGYQDFLIKGLLTGTGMLLLYGVIEYALKENILFVDLFRTKYHYRSISMSQSGNYGLQLSWENPLLTACLLSSLSALFLSVKCKQYSWFFLVLCLAEAFCTGKRTGTIFALLNILLYYCIRFFYHGGKLSKKVTWWIVSVSAILILCLPVIEGSSLIAIAADRFMQLSSTRSLSGVHRIVSMEKSLEVFADSSIWGMLFGHGTSALGTFFADNSILIVVDGYYVIDNSYISFLYDYGLLNSILSLIFFIYIIRGSVRCIMKSSSFQKEKVAVLTGFLILLVTSSVFDALTWYTSVFLLALYIAYLLQMVKTEKRKWKEERGIEPCRLYQ